MDEDVLRSHLGKSDVVVTPPAELGGEAVSRG